MTTATQIIDRAYTLLGYKDPADALSGQDTSYALGVLNSMVDLWNTQSYFIVSTSAVVTTVTGNPISIGAGQTINTARPVSVENGSFIRNNGVDFPIEWISREEYGSIAYKGVTSNIAVYGYYEPTLPYGAIYLYPYPVTPVELHLQLNNDVEQFADLTTDYNIAPGYLKALQYSLAEELAPGLRDLPAQVAKQAFLARRAIRRVNATIPMLDMGEISFTPYQRFLSGV